MASTLFLTQSRARHGNATTLISLLALPCMHRICCAATYDMKKTSPSEIITRRTFDLNGVWTDSAIAHRLGFFFLCLATHSIVLINRHCRKSTALLTLRLLLKEWPQGSIEEAVQNAVKSWEMELSHKTRLQDFKTVNPEKFKLIVNGREGLSGEETLRLGSYNALPQNSLPEEFRYYKADKESFESSHDAFRPALPRGFAWEVVSVYSGPPVITYKFRHWRYLRFLSKSMLPLERWLSSMALEL
ncbi:hypothetical protein NL676_027162 [Syzygium grande]|nr:hypothetical protein NL676_027162 [Syzygium grande]